MMRRRGMNGVRKGEKLRITQEMQQMREKYRNSKKKKKIKRKTAGITYLVVKSLQNVATENSGVVYATILKYRIMR
jgi:ribosomal protein L19E